LVAAAFFPAPAEVFALAAFAAGFFALAAFLAALAAVLDSALAVSAFLAVVERFAAVLFAVALFEEAFAVFAAAPLAVLFAAAVALAADDFDFDAAVVFFLALALPDAFDRVVVLRVEAPRDRDVELLRSSAITLGQP